jgi:hypothetical protein
MDYLSPWLGRFFGLLPRRENLIVIFVPFDEPFAWFSDPFLY